MTAQKTEIVLTREDWWNELGTQGDKLGLPGELIAKLRGLIGTELNKISRAVYPPSATPNTILLVKKHLVGVLLRFIDEAGDKFRSVGIFVPDSQNADKMGSFFVLLPEYRGGTVKRPEELP